MQYLACPGGQLTDYDEDRLVGHCPECDYTFSSLFPTGVVPPHYVSEDGDVVVFVPR